MVECDRCHRKFATYGALKQHYADQHTNAKWPELLERELVNERDLQANKVPYHPTQRSHTKLIVAIILIVIAVTGGAIYLPGALQGGSSNCANFPFPQIGGQDLAVHYHALLLIYVNGQQVQLPAGIGDGDSGPCPQPLHIHKSDAAGIIHIESPEPRSYTLGDFFKVWAATPNIGGPTPVVFNQNQLFNYTVGNGNELRLYVNGKLSNAYDTLVFQSQMTIVVAYGNSATTDWAHYQDLSGLPWPYPNL